MGRRRETANGESERRKAVVWLVDPDLRKQSEAKTGKSRFVAFIGWIVSWLPGSGGTVNIYSWIA
jgi:hypothetical protein